MTRSGVRKSLVLPLLDAIALSSIVGAHILTLSADGSSPGAYYNTRIFLTVAGPVALAVLVIEVVLHAAVLALAQRSAARRDAQVPLVQRARRGQRIRQVVLLPLLDSIVLGLIVGALILTFTSSTTR